MKHPSAHVNRCVEESTPIPLQHTTPHLVIPAQAGIQAYRS